MTNPFSSFIKNTQNIFKKSDHSQKSINPTPQSKNAGINSSSHLQSIIYDLSAPIWSSRNYQKFADEAYRKNVIAHRAITLISQSASLVPWKLYQKKQYRNGRSSKPQLIDHHPLLELLARPNANLSQAELIEQIINYRLLAGNSYIHAHMVHNQVRELHILRPDRMQVITAKNGQEIAYQYKTCASKHHDFPIDPITGKSDILHMKYFHPLDDYYGLSPVEAASYSIDQHNQAAIWNQALLQNGARPSGAIMLKSANNDNLTPDQFDRLRDQITECFAGASNAGRPMVLEGGMEWREMSLSNKDMDFMAAKNSAAREIAFAFGVPPQLIGIPGDNTYNNMQEARLALWEETILPILNNIKDSFNNWLVPMFNDSSLYLDYDEDAISALSLRRENLWRRIESASFLTQDEKRVMLGLSPVDQSSDKYAK